MFGIEDKMIWLPYLLCLASTALCVIYGFITWNSGDEVVHREDIEWAVEERHVEEDL